MPAASAGERHAKYPKPDPQKQLLEFANEPAATIEPGGRRTYNYKIEVATTRERLDAMLKLNAGGGKQRK